MSCGEHSGKNNAYDLLQGKDDLSRDFPRSGSAGRMRETRADMEQTFWAEERHPQSFLIRDPNQKVQRGDSQP